jgi:hypothetical protein
MNTETQHIWLPELGYFVVATPSAMVGHTGHPLSVNFVIYEACKSGDSIQFETDDEGMFSLDDYSKSYPTTIGDIKWDGCSNWDFTERSIHFCGRDGPLKLATAMAACHDHAGVLFGGYC